MPLLRFKAEDVRRVVEHSINAPEQGEQTVSYEPHTTKPVAAPSVALVRDSGVYLMSTRSTTLLRSWPTPRAAIPTRMKIGTIPRTIWLAAMILSSYCRGHPN